MHVSLHVLCRNARHLVAVLALHAFTGHLTFAGSHALQSDPITVDTRDTGAFKVTDVSSRYCSGSYGTGGRHVYFLAGADLSVQFTATVEWGGKTGSRLEFNGVNNGLNYSRSAAVGSLAPGGKLEVVAVATDGTRSAPFRANFDVVVPPPFYGAILHAEASLPWSQQLTYSTPSLDVTPFSAVRGTLQLGKSIPGLSGETMRIAPSFKVSVTVDGNAGTMRVKPGIGAKGETKLNNTQSRKPDGTFGKAAALDLALYLEGEVIAAYDKGLAAWRVTEGWLGIEVSSLFKTRPAYFSVSPPLYGYLELGADGYFSYRIVSLSPTADPSADFRFSGEALPKIQIVVGLGVSRLLAFEAYGGVYGILDIRGGPPVVCDKLGVKGKIGGRGVLIGWTTKTYDIWSGTYWIKNTSLGIDRLASAVGPLVLSEAAWPNALAPLDTRQFHLLERDYLDRGRLRPMALMPVARLIPLTGGTETTLVTDAYPYPEPTVAMLGATNHVLYLRDNPSRLPENRTELVHVWNAGAGWSTPAVLWDDGTADFGPQLTALPDGALLAVWANEGAALTNGASLDEALAGLEIAAGRRDPSTGTWTCQNLTSNGWLDHSPALSAAGDGNSMVAWIRNRHGNPTGTTNAPNEVLVSRWNRAAWSAEHVVATNAAALTYLDVACRGPEAALVFALDTDGDLSTQTDQELYGCAYTGAQWGAATRLTSNAVQDTRPYAYYTDDGTLLVVWFRDGKIVSAEGLALANPVEVGEIGIASGAQDFKLATGPDGQLGLVWQDAGADGVAAPDPHIINYDPTRGAWSRGVRLLEDPSLERGFSGAYGADGRLRLAYSKVAVDENAEGVPTLGAVDLCVLDHPVGPDPAIGAAGVVLSTNAAEVGESVDILVTVENCGELTVTNLAVCVYVGNPTAGGTVIGATQRVTEVIGGATATVTVPWTVPAVTNNVALYAVVDPGQETDDRNRANNTATLAALMPDLAIRGASVQSEAPTVRLLTVSVVNEGSAPVPAGALVTFRRGATDGALLAQETLDYMAAGSNGAYEAGFRWDMAGGVFTSAFEMVYVAADPAGAVQEIETRNNTVALQVMTTLDTDGDGLLDGEELQLGTSVSSPDTDGDGLGDAAETRTYGTDPLRADTDGDGSSDGHEIAAGTDPLSATDVFKTVTIEGTTNYFMAVTWNAKSGTTYRVDMTSDLRGTWTNAPSGIGPEEQSQRTAASNGVLRYLDSTPGPMTNRFYRVNKLP